MKKTKNIKNYKRKSYKKHCVYNVEDNNLSKESLPDNSNFDIEKSIDKELVTLFKENINKILDNE